jgi:hypothetical protein
MMSTSQIDKGHYNIKNKRYAIELRAVLSVAHELNIDSPNRARHARRVANLRLQGIPVALWPQWSRQSAASHAATMSAGARFFGSSTNGEG